MRSGVRARPSRVGSSPSRTSNSRNNSAVLADINVTGSSVFLTISVPLVRPAQPRAATLHNHHRSLHTNFSSTGIFKGVEHGFFHPDLLYFGMMEALREN